MKWLIILILISCGKHQEPAAIDFQDSDGDLIINENDSEKEIANFETLGPVKGVLRIDSDVLTEVSFSNENKLEQKTIDLLIKNERYIKSEDYFSEWSKINLEKLDLSKFRSMKQYNLTMSFDSDSDQADEIAIVQDHKIRNLGPWLKTIRLNFSYDDLKSLIEGGSYLSLRKKFRKAPFSGESQDLSIKNKTNRIYFFDGKISKIFYISKELSLKKIMDIFEIKEYSAITDDGLFFNSDLEQHDQWLTRELSTGDKVIVFSNPKSMKEEFIKKYHYTKTIIKRENGQSVSKLKINKPVESMTYLRIKKVVKSVRTFTESRVLRTHATGGPRSREGYTFDCVHSFRNIASEAFLDPSFSDLLDNVRITSNKEIISVDILRNAQIVEQKSLQGVYWELKLHAAFDNLEISLIPKEKSSFVVTGEYTNNCGTFGSISTGPNSLTNYEGVYSLEIESLVEKIDD